METEATIVSPHAVEILETYNAAIEEVGAARERVEHSVASLVRCGSLVEAAFAREGKNFCRWWQDQVRAIPFTEAKRLLRIRRRADRAMDGAQLKLAGLLPPTAGTDGRGGERDESDGMEWHRQVGALLGRAGKLLEQLDADATVATRQLAQLTAPERGRLADRVADVSNRLADVAKSLRAWPEKTL